MLDADRNRAEFGAMTMWAAWAAAEWRSGASSTWRNGIYNRQAVNFAVRLDGKLIGEAVLYRFDCRGGAELGCRIDKAYAGNGYGTEASRCCGGVGPVQNPSEPGGGQVLQGEPGVLQDVVGLYAEEEWTTPSSTLKS